MLLESIVGGFRATVPCKVNLFLEVLDRRDDGYHNLDTIMLAVSICDVLEMTRRDDALLNLSIDLSADCMPLSSQDNAWKIPSDDSNLILRSLRGLRGHLGSHSSGLDIRLVKRIPSQAGLGGGSANAAAALVLGSLLWSNGIDYSVISRAASTLGSDINFFVDGHNGSSWLAHCTGRGEIVRPLQAAHPLYFVIAHPPVGCSTKDVFERVRRSLKQEDHLRVQESKVVEQDLKNGDLVSLGSHLFNRLENAARETTNWIERSAKRLDRYNPLGQSLTGSGSARFCLCSSLDQAEKIASEISESRDMRVYSASTWHSQSIQEQAEVLRRGS